MRNKKYERQYERYDYLKKLHICVNCGNEESEPNSIYCLECKEKIYLRNKNYYKKNKENLIKKNREYFKNLYYVRKEQGICTKCGKRKVSKNSKTLCIDCYAKRKRKKDKRWNNDIERCERVGFGLCYICGKQRRKHDTLCDKCFNNASTRMKKLNANPSEKMLEARENYKKEMSNFRNVLFKNIK